MGLNGADLSKLVDFKVSKALLKWCQLGHGTQEGSGCREQVENCSQRVSG